MAVAQSSPFRKLPTEILQAIVDHCIPSVQPTSTKNDHSERQTYSQTHSISTNQLLLVSKQLYEVVLRHLYTHLVFRSMTALKAFERTFCSSHRVSSAQATRIPYAPRNISIHIHNDLQSCLFGRLRSILSIFHLPPLPSTLSQDLGPSIRHSDRNSRLVSSGYGSLASICHEVDRDDQGRIILDTLLLQCFSHSMDPNLAMIFESLSLVSPRNFIWTGPDPPHHFSIAIVRAATPHLFRALQTYTNLTSLKLTNIAMGAPNGAIQEAVEGFVMRPYPQIELPCTTSLRTIYIGQATHVNAQVIASAFLSPENTHLQELRLVDAYKESIWGPRLRRSDLEHASAELVERRGADDSQAVRELVRSHVICEAVLGRIEGGEAVKLPSILI